jgi:hypothetical protein
MKATPNPTLIRLGELGAELAELNARATALQAAYNDQCQYVGNIYQSLSLLYRGTMQPAAVLAFLSCIDIIIQRNHLTKRPFPYPFGHCKRCLPRFREL